MPYAGRLHGAAGPEERERRQVPRTPPSLLMTLLDTQTDAGNLATALRAGDDETAAALVAHLRLPPRLLTHRGLASSQSW